MQNKLENNKAKEHGNKAQCWTAREANMLI